MSTSSTLVLGTAVGYSEAQIAPFLLSLRRNGYAGDVALFVDPVAARSFAQRPLFADVQLIAAPQWLPLRHPWLKQALAQRWVWRPAQAALWLAMRTLGVMPLPAPLRLRLQMPLALVVFPPTEGRFLRYLRLLQSQTYQRVLLSDVRDVLFQSDPFRALPTHGLAVSMEARRYTIATEKWNAHWVDQLYGADVLRQVGDQAVSCSGVTYGDRQSMLQYLQLMAEEIMHLPWRAAQHGWFDQAIHNVVLRLRFHSAVHELETLGSAVATLGAFSDGELQPSTEGRLLNSDGSVASIVHQYDRLPALKPVLLRQFEATT